MRTFMIMITMLSMGCASHMLEQERNKLMQQAQPQEYIEGYVDGSSSGYQAAGNPYFKFRKDVDRFLTDDLYSQGWTDGFRISHSKYKAILR